MRVLGCQTVLSHISCELQVLRLPADVAGLMATGILEVNVGAVLQVHLWYVRSGSPLPSTFATPSRDVGAVRQRRRHLSSGPHLGCTDVSSYQNGAPGFNPQGGETEALARLANSLADHNWVAQFAKPDGDPALFSPPATTVLRWEVQFVRG